MASGIYLIHNVISGRYYVGSAVDIDQRWRSHRHLLSSGKHHSPTLQRSWLKHGEVAFVFEVVELIGDKALLIAREQYWIDVLRSACPNTGFNVSPTAGSPLGVKHTAETREKWSAARKGRKSAPFSAKHRAALSKARKEYEAAAGRMADRNKSSEMRERVRAAKIKRYATPEGRSDLKAMSDKRWSAQRASGEPLGRKHSEETKMKISISKKGHMTPEHKAAIAASNKRELYR